MFVNEIEIFQFKADNKNVNSPTQFQLGSMSNGFSATEFREVTSLVALQQQNACLKMMNHAWLDMLLLI